MHQTMRKVWAILLVMCLIVGLLPISASAALVDADQYVTQQLSLGEDLVLHLRASMPESAASLAQDAVGTLTYAGKTKTYTMDDMTPDENGMYDMPVEMAVAEMTDDIHAVVTAKVLGVNQEIINEHYSIRDYLVTIIEGDYSQTTKDLCLELLNMGAWAQLYFNYNISNLANADYNISPANPVPEEVPTVDIQGAVEGIRFYGTTVRFLSKAAARFYFEADGAVDGYTFTINGAEVQPTEKDGLYYIETPGINPQNMSDLITVEVTDGSETLTVSYAPIWYFIRTYNKTEDEYSKGLMEAAYSYYKEAASYKTQICMDLDISTLSGSYESIGLGFYPLDFEGDINNQTDLIEVPTGTTYTVKLDQGKYLVDGEFKGIGITVLGGPTWDATLSDGSPDRHNITISDLRLEGPEDRPIDLTLATIASGNEGTGYTNANAGGTASLADGVITIANGFFTDGYKITFNEVDTYLCLDMNFTTLGNSTDKIEVRFYTYGFEGDINDAIDTTTITAGTTSTVKLDAAKYLVDGEIPGIGFAIFGGPAWNTQLEDGTYDRHAITVSNFRLEGENELTFDLSRASVKTGFANANSGGIATVADGIVSVTGGYLYDGHMITFVDETIPEETEPEVTEPEVTEPEVTEPEVTEPEVTEPEVTEPETFDTTLTLDMQIDTLGGDWANDIEIRFYPYSFEGNPHETYTDSVIFKAGEKQTVKLNAEKYLVDGELSGIGIGIFGGPAWDAKLPDGYTPDRHTVTISNVKLEGEQSVAYDLSKSTMTSGTTDTGYTDGNGNGKAAFGESIVISDGFCYDVHKIALVEDTRSFVTMDMQIDTLGGDWANDIEIRFYNYGFEGDPHTTYTDSVIFKAGEKQTVKLNAEQYLVDGELPGIGIGIFGGPEWNTQISDGVYDRHTVTISNVKLEGEQSVAYDLSKSTMVSGASDETGYTQANGSGVGAFVDGVYQITNGFCYDCHKISLVEDTNTYVTLDMQIDTLGGDWTNDIEIRFYNYGFEGNPHEVYTDKVIFKAGEKQTVKLDAEKYLVDGELTGIGIGIFGGPAWDAKLPDGYTPDRHTVTISNVKLEGTLSASYDLSQSTIKSGTADTGYTSANGNGKAAFGESIVISDGFCYDCHKISLVEGTGSVEPEQKTYVVMDMLFTTLGGSTAPVEIAFYPSNFEGDVNNWTERQIITAGTTTTVKLDAEKYLVDGKISGIGIGIFGGPAWDAKLEDGYTPDRHTLTISNARLEGAESMDFDLSKSTVTSGTNGTGFSGANGSGTATIGSSIVITNGFLYDAHKITLVEDTNTYIVMDLQLDTLGGSWANPIDVRFCNNAQEDSVHNTYADLISVTVGEKVTVKLNAEKYLVDGELPGFSIAIFGGPEWNTQLSDGTYDRHSVVISNLRLEGVGAADIDLSTATVSTGISGSNSGGTIAIVDGEIVISGGFCYDGHKIVFGA